MSEEKEPNEAREANGLPAWVNEWMGQTSSVGFILCIDPQGDAGLDVLFLNHAISTLGFWDGSLDNVTSATTAINVNYLGFLKLFSAAQKYLVGR